MTADMRDFRFIITLSLLVLGAPLRALAQPDAPAEQAPNPRQPICLMIESAARANALPVDFFVRVIWQESRFQPDAIGRVTRSGQRALGIAQFMPATAAERRLIEPFNAVEALPKSGELLAELRSEFGNLGLAAAAYNAGPRRVREFITGSRGLPEETRNYVMAITGRSVEDWAMPATEESNEGNKDKPHANRGLESCRDIVALLERPPDRIGAELQQRRVPSWCRSLHHPDKSVCGTAHLAEPAIKISSLVKAHGHVPFPASSR